MYKIIATTKVCSKVDFYIDSTDELNKLEDDLYSEEKETKLHCVGATIVVGLMGLGSHIDESNEELAKLAQKIYVAAFRETREPTPPTQNQKIDTISLIDTHNFKVATSLVDEELVELDLFNSNSLFTLHFYGKESSHSLFFERTKEGRYLTYNHSQNKTLSLKNIALFQTWIGRAHTTHRLLNNSEPDIAIQLCVFSRK
ncbi:hypothetical protein DID80_04510 [Candidatus Marinamargulisbacteria bacterium SCGC AAA071-K20]|nr:hypothetical protein DID80_04510 [Candidatus Marinamargulisbacteria bacterium SCGC AAA071-K20]